MANVFLWTFSKVGLFNLRLNTESIIDEAFSRTGLRKYFQDSLFKPLDKLINSFNQDADLNSLGRTCVRFDLLRMLCNNLKIAATRELNPQIAEEKVRSPLFITGLPRSGTTLLHSLLAQDAAVRVPQVWETMYPCPPPETASYQSDGRVIKTEQDLRWLDFIIPDFKRVHMIGATLPQECIVITGHTFMSQVFESMYYVNSYRSWHENEDKLPEYEFHRKFLQHLQWRCPGTRWVLKAPSHLFGLDSIMKVYPDAKIIFTHRDPLKVISSCASFSEILRSPFTNAHIDRCELGLEISRHWEKGAHRAIAFREGLTDRDGRLLDVHYRELVERPIETVQRIYEYFQWELTEEAKQRMKNFLAENPINRNGKHTYSLEDFGLDAEDESRKFEQYVHYFGIESEDDLDNRGIRECMT